MCVCVCVCVCACRCNFICVHTIRPTRFGIKVVVRYSSSVCLLDMAHVWTMMSQPKKTTTSMCCPFVLCACLSRLPPSLHCTFPNQSSNCLFMTAMYHTHTHTHHTHTHTHTHMHPMYYTHKTQSLFRLSYCFTLLCYIHTQNITKYTNCYTSSRLPRPVLQCVFPFVCVKGIK